MRIELGDKVVLSKRGEAQPYRLTGVTMVVARVPYGKRQALLCEAPNGERELIWRSHLKMEPSHAKAKRRALYGKGL